MVMQAAQDSPAVKNRKRRVSTAHARRRAKVYSNAVKKEVLEEQIADELRSSHESGLASGSAAFLKGLLSETDSLPKRISERYQIQREVSGRWLGLGNKQSTYPSFFCLLSKNVLKILITWEVRPLKFPLERDIIWCMQSYASKRNLPIIACS